MQERGGVVGSSMFRVPDLMLLHDENDLRWEDEFWLGADLVAECVISETLDRDYIKKRRDYAAGGIPEYWIVDPPAETITVLRLDGGQYVEHGVFRRGQRATSTLLAGFGVDVGDLFGD